MIASLLLAAAAQAGAAPAFAPPLDQPLRLVVHQDRVQAGRTRRYEIERTLVFRHNSTGLIAEMTLVRVWQDEGGASGRRFEVAAGALKGRTMRLHLSAAGAVTAIEDETALWAATLAGIAGIAVPDRRSSPATGLARDPTAALAALPPDRRRAALASPLAAIVADPASDWAPGHGAITLDGDPAGGGVLTGTRAVTSGTDRRLPVIVHASRPGPDRPVTLDRERIVDPTTGLVVEARETRSMGASDTAQIARQTVTLSRPVS